MEITPTIRVEVQTYLIRKSLTMTEFGHIIDLNVGTVSGIVTGNRPISVHQLDRITMGMNLPSDYFYERLMNVLKKNRLTGEESALFCTGARS